ncbi:ABC transporter permease [Planomonospora venezuelensis]|uniref:Transport permease protein n=1 Tax=Planomonospora venezuelensis TaxID=1999 RepID=A0A841DF00_PLAVE|nr:ABC transporter permease [Planomonospora venezuelensis]MBB5966878.1 ABC-type multidrug transport system permease subunit [Planomonospora venezuelensis]GIN02379.1 transport permease protein [Planomonospora venezuelensis]
MTTSTASTASTAPAAPGRVLPSGPLARVRWAVADSWTVTRRYLIHWVREPSYVVWGLMYPMVSVLLFGYVFGSAMVVPGGGDYREFLLPGLFGMTMMFGIGNTMMGVTTDADKGITDRFRAMPMARSAVVVGRSTADMINSVMDLVILILCGLIVGWRAHGTAGETLAAVGLLLLLRFAFIWVGIYLGLRAKNAETAGNFYALLFPLTMISNAFVAPEMMPGWLGAAAAWNPLSSTVAAIRELFGNPGLGGDSWIAQNALLMAVAWPLAIVALFLPLSVRRYRRARR